MAESKLAEVEETLKRIGANKSVIGTILVDTDGIPLRTTLDNSTSVQYAKMIQRLVMMTRSTVRDIDPRDDLTFLRVGSKTQEILIAPENGFILIVIQSLRE